ncbi:MAG: LytR/AlgR family response regulator transcription factor [Gemmatimonas sp.]
MIRPLFRVLLVDDEPLARQELRRLLSDFADRLEVVGEVSTIASAKAAILELEPDLVLLDITLPDGNGVQWLSTLDTAPHVVFVTAHQSYVFRALELNALDYLLKPVTATRLATTMARVLPSLEATAQARGATEATPAMEAASYDEGGGTASRHPLALHDRVFLSDGEAGWFVTLGEIRLLEVHGESTRVHFGRGSAVSPRSLRLVEARLPARAFLRANRTQIVGVHWIREVRSWFAGRLLLRLDGGHEVVVSRRQSRAMAEQLRL